MTVNLAKARKLIGADIGLAIPYFGYKVRSCELQQHSLDEIARLCDRHLNN